MQSAGVRLGSLGPILCLCILAAFAGGGHTWHKQRNEQFSRQIQAKQTRLEELRMQDRYLERQLADLRSYRTLARRVQELNLGLVMPRPEQILRLQETPAGLGRPALAAAVRNDQPNPGP
jgi:cell division protein FtsB